MRKSYSLLLTVLLMLMPLLLWANEPVDLEMVARIRAEATENSHVEQIMFHLSDVHGPRLTNSPNYIEAGQWCVEKLTEWGLENSRLEPWGTFGKGWTVERFSVEMIEPEYLNMIAYPQAWTAGTGGVISGEPVLLDVESEEDIERYRGKLAGAIVMTRTDWEAQTHFEADAKRHTAEDLAELVQAPEPGAKPSWWARREEYRRRRALQRKLAELYKEEDVAVILEPSRREHGTIRVHSGGSFKMDAAPGIPAVTVAIEHYSRIVRLLENGIPVKLAIDVETQFHQNDSLGYNVTAEIPGRDKKLRDELVMLGGHLDSWHAGTGATDNASGCAVAMEAVRILQSIGAKPRRTIRIALWGGEEQGLLGSRGYVEKHFGDRETMELKPAHAEFSAYFNLDNGTGKIRGIYLQENDAVRPIFEAYLEPFHDLGAEAVTIRNTSGTDHLAFDALGLPGFQFIQDPIDYRTRTHHSNMDVYDHALESDLIQASMVMASFVYHTAMRDEKLPRKPLPKPRGSGDTNGTIK